MSDDDVAEVPGFKGIAAAPTLSEAHKQTSSYFTLRHSRTAQPRSVCWGFEPVVQAALQEVGDAGVVFDDQDVHADSTRSWPGRSAQATGGGSAC
jgi:hypothetical protein